MRRTIGIGILTTYLVFAVAGMAMAATEQEKRLAVEAGLAYLAATQNSDGSWPAGDIEGCIYSSTGSSVLAFLQAKDYWGNNAPAYQAVVDKGLDFILGNASIVPISLQQAGDPDGDGNGVGVKLYPGTSNYEIRDIHVTGICLPAIAASGTPDKVVTNGSLAFRIDGSGPGGSWTYRDVVQNVIDYFAYGQHDGLYPYEQFRGGWRYRANYGYSADQTSTQWAAISGMYASLMGVNCPEFVLNELNYWTEHIQNDESGAAGYTHSSYLRSPMGETGALLTMLFFLGKSPGDPSVDAALNYINENWQSYANYVYSGNFGHPYTMRAIYNGLGFMIGLDDEETITNLRPDPGYIDSGDHGYNWWEDYCEFLVKDQNADGSWSGYTNWNQWVATPWYIYTLVPGFGLEASGSEPSAIEVPVDIKPAGCPNLLNVVSKGMLAVAIAGSEELDVTTIDPLTIQLAGVVPIHYSYDDVTSPYNPMTGKEDAHACTEEGPDGYPDMILMFNTQAIVSAIGDIEDGDVVVLNLTGYLQEELGGTAIIGEDVVSILKKGKGGKRK